MIDREQGERVILLVILGTLSAIECKKVSFEDAFFLIFSFATTEFIERIKGRKKLAELVSKCMELDDINDLAPNAFNSTISSLKIEALDLLGDCEGISEDADRWFKMLDR